MGTIASNSIRQMQQKCVPEYTCSVFKMAAELEGNVECSVASFMEELQRYESLYSKFSKDYKNKQVRDNGWLALGKKFNMTVEEAEKKYKSIRSSYGRWLRNFLYLHVSTLAQSLVQSELFSPLIYRPNPKSMLSAFSSIPSPS